MTLTSESNSSAAEHALPARLNHLLHQLEHAAHLLPAQGPIRVFVHHNTLHSFEELPFDKAVVAGARTFSCQPYLAESRYRDFLQRGRIRTEDLQAVLRDDLGERAGDKVANLSSRLDIRSSMLGYSLRSAPTAELRWLVAETDALNRFRSEAPSAVREGFIDETRRWIMRDWRNGHRPQSTTGEPDGAELVTSLLEQFGRKSIERWTAAQWEAISLQLTWRLCLAGARHFQPAAPQPTAASRRHRTVLFEATGLDIDLWVDDVMIRFCGAFLDQGFARWPLPDRSRGFLRSFCELYDRLAPIESWMKQLGNELQRVRSSKQSALALIAEILDDLGVEQGETADFIGATLLALRGWAGMVWQVETRGDRAVVPIPHGSLVEYLAVRLLLERVALNHAQRTVTKFRGPLSQLRQALAPPERAESQGLEQRAFRLFQLAQVLGWSPNCLYGLSPTQWEALSGEVEAFHGLERRRVLQAAYERNYRQKVLDAHAIRNRLPVERPREPLFQVITCIDDREESFRRHIEEVEPRAETFGAAGFFSVAMYYRGAGDAQYVPLCPVVVQPQHFVREDVMVTYEESHKRRAKTRQALGNASHSVHVGSRTIAGGALLTGLFGPLASVPLVARVLFPRFTGQIKRFASRLVQPPPMTQLQLERSAPTPGNHEEEIGFSVEEMTNICERLLRDMGLTSNFARLVLVMGHGSNSLNNPHKSAYDCGACGGGAGGPNARAISEMMNDPRVREGLAARGLTLTRDTYFVGAFHNTCDDSITYYDLERLPKSHQRSFGDAFRAIDEACDRNAHERCRRFVSAPLSLTFEQARRHVEARSEDLAQTRPECGHATNAICMVGRRERTRGLFMDRRAFLTSYDPTQDTADSAILTRILQAVVPVCGGINLEYYFSYVDPTGWGCGTKLPHNVSSMLGVMDGPLSDLRTGLPWQMVEIHEPVRLLFVIESTPERLRGIMQANPPIARMIENHWVQLATLSPDNDEIHVYERGEFHRYQPEVDSLPNVDNSVEWYRGWRDHLGFALVRPSLPTTNEKGR
ncbi:MAG: DUF2309 domain-containing protein [Planctomycetales bacterium]|nr:DUF2309 domain-containing protein [Planctomycetales bacterium]